MRIKNRQESSPTGRLKYNRILKYSGSLEQNGITPNVFPVTFLEKGAAGRKAGVEIKSKTVDPFLQNYSAINHFKDNTSLKRETPTLSYFLFAVPSAKKHKWTPVSHPGGAKSITLVSFHPK